MKFEAHAPNSTVMKRSLFFSLAWCLAFSVQAQESTSKKQKSDLFAQVQEHIDENVRSLGREVVTYKASVSKTKTYPFQLISETAPSILVSSNGDGGSTLIEDDHRYDYKYGWGRKKDDLGYREKHKRYLVRDRSERLLTIYYRDGKFRFNDGSIIRTREIADGWEFRNHNGDVIAQLDMATRSETWEFTWTTFQQNENTETLTKYMALTMSMWAWHKNIQEDERNDDPGIGDALWLLTFINRY